MEKFYVGDDSEFNKSNIYNQPLTEESLRQILFSMGVSAELEVQSKQYVIRVFDFVGNSNYLASGDQDVFWLKKKAYKVERKGSIQVFYIKKV